jgi:hypothetical protein
MIRSFPFSPLTGAWNGISKIRVFILTDVFSFILSLPMFFLRPFLQVLLLTDLFACFRFQEVAVPRAASSTAHPVNE